MSLTPRDLDREDQKWVDEMKADGTPDRSSEDEVEALEVLTEMARGPDVVVRASARRFDE